MSSGIADEAPIECRTLATGAPGLDQILGGGLPRASTTLVVGGSGIGKTTLGLNFIMESTPEEPGLIFGFYETPPRLRLKARELGLDLERKIEEGSVEIIWNSPGDQTIDVLGHRLLQAVERRGVKRLLIDGMSALKRAFVYPQRIAPFFAALAYELRCRDVTALFTSETPRLVGGEAVVHLGEKSAIAENVVLLRYLGAEAELKRAIAAVKVRDLRHCRSIYEFTIEQSGIRVGEKLGEYPLSYSGAPYPRQLAD